MATREDFNLNLEQRLRRRFSEGFKRSKVEEIERGVVTAAQVSRQYQVRYSNVMAWKKKYGSNRTKSVRLIVEMESDTHQLIDLQKRIAQLEQLLGQKQVLIEFQDKMIDLAEQAYGVDIKKKFGNTPSSTFGKDEKS